MTTTSLNTRQGVTGFSSTSISRTQPAEITPATESQEDSEREDDTDYGLHGTEPCIVDGGVCRSRIGALFVRRQHRNAPCNFTTGPYDQECNVLPDNITAQSRLYIQRIFPVQLQSLAGQVLSKMDEHYARFRREEMQDAQKVERILASLTTVKDTDLPDAVMPIMQSAEESIARHFELGISLEGESARLITAIEAYRGDAADTFELEYFLEVYWEKYRVQHIDRILRWLNSRIHRWNHAFGFQNPLPKTTNLGPIFTQGGEGIGENLTQREYFTPSNLTETIGYAIGSIVFGFTPAGVIIDIRDLAIAARALQREGFSWSTASGLLLAGIGFIPGAGDAAKTLGKLAKESRSRGVIQVVESMKQRAINYQTKITGLPSGQAYELNGVKFDGFKDGILLEAKGLGYAKFVKDGEFVGWWEKTGLERLLEQAQRQYIAAQGRRIQWHFAEEEPARLLKKLFKKNTIDIDIIVTP